MRTTTPSKTTSASGFRRVLLATALSVPLSALMLSGTALAAGPNGGGAPDERGGSAAAPGQQASENAGSDKPAKENGGSGGKDKQTAAAEPAPAPSAPAQPKEQPQPAKKAEPAPSSAPKTGSSNGTSGTATSPQPLSGADKNGTGANPGTSCTHAYCSTRDGSPSLNGNGGGQAGGKPCAGCVGKADNKNPRGQAPNGSDRNNGYECDGNKGIGKGNPAHTGCAPSTGVQPGTPTTPVTPGQPTTPAKPEKPGKPATPNTPDSPECVAGSMAAECVPATPPASCPAGSMAAECVPATPPASCPAGSMAAECAPATPPASCIAGDAAGPQAPGCPAPGTTVTGGVLADALIPAALRSPSIVPLAAVAPQALTLSPKSAAAAAATPSALPFTGADLAVLLPLSLIALAVGIALVGFGRARTADQQ